MASRGGRKTTRTKKDATGRLVALDVDGTVVPMESSWWTVHMLVGTEKRAWRNYELFSRGKIRYEEWAERDASLWKGFPISKLKEVFQSVEPDLSLYALRDFLAEHRTNLALISSGIDILVSQIARKVGTDIWYANRLLVENGLISGKVRVSVPLDDKGRIISRLRKRYSTIIAIGDSRWDESMFEKSDFSIRMRGNRNQRRKNYTVTRETSIGLAIPILGEYFGSVNR